MTTCPYCGDGPESVGTLNHIECVTELMTVVERLAAKNRELNRRCQAAESAVLEKIRDHPGVSMGRSLANAGYEIAIRERDEALAEVESLKCCGNCGHHTCVPDYVPKCRVLDSEIPCDDYAGGGDWPDPARPCMLPRIGHPSRWTERKEAPHD